jgi:hypothetical protein
MEQAMALASVASAGAFVEDGSFTRLREVAISVEAPRRLAHAVSGRAIVLTLSGRNLALWSGYSGWDPETRSAGSRTYDVANGFEAPLPRAIALRVDYSR